MNGLQHFANIIMIILVELNKIITYSLILSNTTYFITYNILNNASNNIFIKQGNIIITNVKFI